MKSMTPAEWREFLLLGTLTAKVVTVRSSGYPHVAPVWPVLDGDELVFTTGKTSIKGKESLAGAPSDDLRGRHSYLASSDISVRYFGASSSTRRRFLADEAEISCSRL
jgi:hypothetical protein